MSRWLLPAALAVFVLGLAATARPAAATQVWTGRTYAFSKAANANPALAANQDRITPLVWITRASTQGIFNANTETLYSHYLSPAGTEWATGDAVNYGSLTFADWETWAQGNGGPPSTVGLNACVHLIAEDIYIDIRFDSWSAISGGAFSYHRAVQPVTPTQNTTWGRIKSLYR